MSKETNEQGGGGKPAGKGRFSVVLALTIGITVGAAVGSFVVGPLLADAPAEPVECEDLVLDEEGDSASKKPAVVHTVDNLVLNPAQSGGTRFLISTVAVSVRDSAAVASLAQRDSELRDGIIRILGSKTVPQLAETEGRGLLKEELLTELRRMFGEKTVRDVFFPQFVIQ